MTLRTRDDYRRALARIDKLRASGATAGSNAELADLEAAIADYVAKPGHPDWRKGRPDEGGSDSM